MSRIVPSEKTSNRCGCGCQRCEAESKNGPSVRGGLTIQPIPIAMDRLSSYGRVVYGRVVKITYSMLTTMERFVASKSELEPNEKVVVGFDSKILGCVVPYHRLHEAVDRMVKEFDRLVVEGVVKSVLCQMSSMELAHPKINDLMMYELMERVAPDRVRGIPKPVVGECDRHAVFMMVHGDWKGRPLEQISEYLADEGADLKELPQDKEFGLRLGGAM